MSKIQLFNILSSTNPIFPSELQSLTIISPEKTIKSFIHLRENSNNIFSSLHSLKQLTSLSLQFDGIGIGDKALIQFSEALINLQKLKKLQIIAELNGIFPQDGIYIFEEDNDESQETNNYYDYQSEEFDQKYQTYNNSKLFVTDKGFEALIFNIEKHLLHLQTLQLNVQQNYITLKSMHEAMKKLLVLPNLTKVVLYFQYQRLPEQELYEEINPKFYENSENYYRQIMKLFAKKRVIVYQIIAITNANQTKKNFKEICMQIALYLLQ